MYDPKQIGYTKAEYDKLQAENERLRKELWTYGGHHDDCTTEFGDYSCRENPTCECGWSMVEHVLLQVLKGSE